MNAGTPTALFEDLPQAIMALQTAIIMLAIIYVIIKCILGQWAPEENEGKIDADFAYSLIGKAVASKEILERELKRTNKCLSDAESTIKKHDEDIHMLTKKAIQLELDVARLEMSQATAVKYAAMNIADIASLKGETLSTKSLAEELKVKVNLVEQHQRVQEAINKKYGYTTSRYPALVSVAVLAMLVTSGAWIFGGEMRWFAEPADSEAWMDSITTYWTI